HRAGDQHLGLHRPVRVSADAHGRHGAASVSTLAGRAGLRVFAAAGRLRLRLVAAPEAAVTALPPPSKKKMGLVIDLDTCVGCHACATSCKEWNAGGIAGPLTDEQPYGKDPAGVWFNRVHGYELAGTDGDDASPPQPAMTLHFPRSCLHCETPACVTVCPTGASYKRAEDGIVLVDEDKCIGCKLCSWACPYGAREYSPVEGVMKKCTLCVDRIYNEN